MARHRKYDEDSKQGAVRLVLETGKPLAHVARDLRVNDGTALGMHPTRRL
jgi:transposase